MRAPTIGWFSVAFVPHTRIVLRLLDVVERVGRRAGAEHRLERGCARGVAHARATIDVVRAEHDPRELLREVVVLVGGARRSEHADAGRAVTLQQALEVPRDVPDRAASHETSSHRPSRADHRAGDAIVGVHEPVRVSTLHAEMPLAHRRVEHRAEPRRFAGRASRRQLAADTAVWARRARPLLRRRRARARSGPRARRSGRCRRRRHTTRTSSRGAWCRSRARCACRRRVPTPATRTGPAPRRRSARSGSRGCSDSCRH